jgi:exosortase
LVARQVERRLTSTTSGTLTYQSRVDRRQGADEPVWYGLTLTAWLKIGIVTALMVLLFWPNLRRLWDKTNPIWGEDNWKHAIAIPIVGLYYLFANREQLLAARPKTAWSGAVILLGGILLFGYGIFPGQNDFVKDFGMVVTLFGVVALLAGWGVMKVAWFPIAFLVCGIPWPGLVYSWLAGPLQHLAASVAVFVLGLTGVDATNTGTKIVMPAGRVLNVAEACAGLRSLMTFITVAAALAFLSVRPMWQKIVQVLSAIPIAVFCNVMRVSGQGLLDHYWSYEASEGFAHQFVGIIMLIPALFLILLVGWVLDHLFTDEIDEKEKLKARVVRKIVTPPSAGVVPQQEGK